MWWPLFGQTPRRWAHFSRGDIPSLALAFAYWCWLCMKLILERLKASTRIGMFISFQKLRKYPTCSLVTFLRVLNAIRSNSIHSAPDHVGPTFHIDHLCQHR